MSVMFKFCTYPHLDIEIYEEVSGIVLFTYSVHEPSALSVDDFSVSSGNFQILVIAVYCFYKSAGCCH